MVLFALSCVGLLLFLWLSFGGVIPLNTQGYRLRVAFPNASQLATQADVRIAGVSVGRVVDKTLDPTGNRTIATIEMQNQYSPIHTDAHAILRIKTILGETYVQLTPGSPNKPAIPDGGLLARGQVAHAVQLDEIFNAFDPQTRHAFQVWQQELAKAVRGNDQNLSDTLGNLPSFATDFSSVLAVLDIEHGAVVNLVRNGGTTFQALNQDPAALRSLITAGETTFSTTAANQDKLAQVFHVFPTFLNEQKLTMARLKNFAIDADFACCVAGQTAPALKELIPVAANLTPTLQAVKALSPPLQHLFVEIGLAHPNLIQVSKTGLPATQQVLHGLQHQGCGKDCLLGATAPFLGELNPILQWLQLHQQLVSDFISNGATPLAAHVLSFAGHGNGHYLRQFGPVGPETLSFAPNRDSNNRGDTYPGPLWLPPNPLDFTNGNLPAWDCDNTGGQHQANDALGQQACWVSPTLPGAKGQKQIPHITATQYSSK
jgi:virulence factor Mce-like protein